MGEQVAVSVTLFSPGPFSGTAAFDLPEIPGVYFLKSGSPLVGSEEVEGESWFTQLHELTVFSQREGEVVIPPIRVRYEGKRSFTGKPEPFAGSTPELRFTSKRPPGLEDAVVVVVASEMEIEQKWSSGEGAELQAGDAVVRTITREAGATSAMMLPPADASSPDGVAAYAGNPEVLDKSERGESLASRTDTITYQFTRGGSFTVPDLTFTWWDPGSESVRSRALEGRTFKVASAPGVGAEDPAKAGNGWKQVLIVLVAILVLAWLLWKPVAVVTARIRRHLEAPERLAAKRVVSACRRNDASGAHAALLHWRRVSGAGQSDQSELDNTLHELARICFGREPEPFQWKGADLLRTFKRARANWRARSEDRSHDSPTLPNLNPR